MKTPLTNGVALLVLSLSTQGRLSNRIFADGQVYVPGEGTFLSKFYIGKDRLIAGYDNRTDLRQRVRTSSYAWHRHPDLPISLFQRPPSAAACHVQP